MQASIIHAVGPNRTRGINCRWTHSQVHTTSSTRKDCRRTGKQLQDICRYAESEPQLQRPKASGLSHRRRLNPKMPTTTVLMGNTTERLEMTRPRATSKSVTVIIYESHDRARVSGID